MHVRNAWTKQLAGKQKQKAENKKKTQQKMQTDEDAA